MKQNVIYFILGLSIAFFISATVNQEVVITKPASPTYTVSYTGSRPTTFTKTWAKQGYQVVSSAANGYYNTYVVMCKYN